MKKITITIFAVFLFTQTCYGMEKLENKSSLKQLLVKPAHGFFIYKEWKDSSSSRAKVFQKDEVGWNKSKYFECECPEKEITWGEYRNLTHRYHSPKFVEMLKRMIANPEKKGELGEYGKCVIAHLKDYKKYKIRNYKNRKTSEYSDHLSKLKEIDQLVQSLFT